MSVVVVMLSSGRGGLTANVQSGNLVTNETNSKSKLSAGRCDGARNARTRAVPAVSPVGADQSDLDGDRAGLREALWPDGAGMARDGRARPLRRDAGKCGMR